MYKQNKELVLGVVIVLLVIAIAYNSLHLTGLFLATNEWEEQWENKIELELNSSMKYIEYQVNFGIYKPSVCSEGIWVTDGINDISFTIEDEIYVNNLCESAKIEFRNPIYTSRRVSIEPIAEETSSRRVSIEPIAIEQSTPNEDESSEETPERAATVQQPEPEATAEIVVPDQPRRSISITGRAITNSIDVYIFYGKKPLVPEYNKIEDDPEFDVIIEGQTVANNSLIVTFYHNSDEVRNISVLGDVEYSLSQSNSQNGEMVELMVDNWQNQYFQLVIE